MDRIVVKGGRRLHGEVIASGAKNSALPILASTLLSKGENRLSNVPDLVDVATMNRLLEHLGAKIKKDGHTVIVRADELKLSEAPYSLVKTMRASVLVLGALSARFGEARISLPGGCSIGARPINLHLMGLEKMGAEVKVEHGYVQIKAKRLHGALIHFDYPTVTGTENLIMAATLADGTTIIENAAREPEIVDLVQFLIKRGAKIQGAGSSTITINGVEELHSAEHHIIPDRIETGTYLLAGVITGGEVTVKQCIPAQLQVLREKLEKMGVLWIQTEDSIQVRSDKPLQGIDVSTSPYPDFPTDMQAQIMALMSVSEGVSVITETVFESRFTHVDELRRMGADIHIEKNRATITGVPELSGAPVMASDLRASTCLILAGLAASGDTIISRVYHLDRGYEEIEQKFGQLGAWIKREKE